MGKLKEIKFDREFLKTLNSLTIIEPSVVIKKETEKNKIVIKRKNLSSTLLYKFVDSVDSFDFDGEYIAFHEFSSFYKCLECFQNPKIFQDSNKLIIQENNTKINFILSDLETVGECKVKPQMETSDAVIKMSSEYLNKIEQVNRNLLMDRVSLMVQKGDSVTLKYGGDKHNNSYESIEKSSVESEKDFNYDIPFDVFSKVPPRDYNFEIHNSGIVRFVSLRKDEDLEIYSAEKDEDD